MRPISVASIDGASFARGSDAGPDFPLRAAPTAGRVDRRPGAPAGLHGLYPLPLS